MLFVFIPENDRERERETGGREGGGGGFRLSNDMAGIPAPASVL